MRWLLAFSLAVSAAVVSPACSGARRADRGTSLVAIEGMSAPSAEAQTLDVEGELSIPGTKLLVVEFFATWCAPCMDAVPRWEALRKKYVNKGLRFVVVAVKDDEELCTDVPWTPDVVVCDTEGEIAEGFGAKKLPSAFLWNWQGHLLASKVHVDEVERKIDGWMAQIPRVDVEVELETRKAGVSERGLRRLLASELGAADKLVVVASARERRRLRKIQRDSFRLGADELLQCDIGKEVSANNLLQATVARGARQLRLGLLSAESHCRTRDVYAPWDRKNPGRSVAVAVGKLLASLKRRELQLPMAVQMGGGMSKPPPRARGDDLDELLARADKLRKEKAAEARARAERKAALEAKWARLEPNVKSDALPQRERIRLLAAFLVEYPDDNPHEETAQSYLALLRAGKEPVSTPSGMVKVPGGTFFMGCNTEVDVECDNDEKPGRRVNVDTFSIDRTEVTVDAYAECVRAGRCTKPSDRSDHKYCNWGYGDRGRHPINCVDWHQARAYCAYRGQRLPTEAEWEKAARGTDGRKYPWGNAAPSCRTAVFDDGRTTGTAGSETDGCGRDSTWPVGSVEAGASPYGALDMAGNVWEWTSDWYSNKRKFRVVRGGGWDNDNPARLRASPRSGVTPSGRVNVLGFRCADS